MAHKKARGGGAECSIGRVTLQSLVRSWGGGDAADVKRLMETWKKTEVGTRENGSHNKLDGWTIGQ